MAATAEPMYGSMGAEDFEHAPQKGKLRSDWKADALPICLSVVVPWLVFVVVFGAMSFSIRYWYPSVSYALVFFCIVVVLGLGGLSGLFAMKGRDPTWFGVMAALGLVAVVLGCCFGGINFHHNIQPFHDAMRLNSYEDVDPNTEHGNQVMDAGQIHFTKAASLDLNRAMGFRNEHMYCVTPIINKQASSPDGRYDFWAVGTNCCSGHPQDFHCGEYDNPYAHSGLRVTSDLKLPYFRLAVKQAEAAFNIKAPHPVFLTWLQDPVDELLAASDTAKHYYNVGLYSYLIGQCVVVGTLSVFLTSLGPWMVDSSF